VRTGAPWFWRQHRLPSSRPRTRVTVATATVATATDDDDEIETEDRPGSPSSVRVRTPARCGSKLLASPTTGKPNVWLSGLLTAPSHPFTSDVSPRRMALAVGENLAVVYAQE
jgi:hypothetical protein